MSTLTEALAPKSDQLNADDLIPGPRTIKITGAKIARSERQLRITLSYEDDNGKPFKPCKTMGRAMVMVWGITDDNYEEQFVGKSIRVYRDPEVKFGDQGAVGGIRISHMSHIDGPKTVKLTVSQGKKSNFVFQPLPKSVGSEGNNDAAGKWAKAYLTKIEQAGSLDALNTLANGKAKLLADLESSMPNAHRQIVNALDAKRASFAPASSFADDTDEGPADSQRGEHSTDDDMPDARAEIIATIRRMIDQAIGEASWDAAKAEFLRHAEALPDDARGELEAELVAKRKGLAA